MLIRRGIAAVFCLSIAWAALHAEEQGPGKGKNSIEIDLNKLPPDVVKQLLKLAGEQAPKPAAKSAEKKGDDEGKGKGPPAEAKGLKLAEFIKGQLGKGRTGDKLAEAINKERAKLGLTDDDKDDEPPSAKPTTPGKGKGKGKD